MTPWAGLFWNKVGRITTLAIWHTTILFFLHKVMSVLLSIPVSNADSEWGFSILKKLHTDQRANLKQDSIMVLMTMNFNCKDCCLNIKLFQDLFLCIYH